jgi:DNA-binding beta-propeller fold protein YncE/mono/diheme cytochrome c family protein
MRYNALGSALPLFVIAFFLTTLAQAQPDYTLFESDPVRPIALTPDGNRLLIANTLDGYLEIFDVSSGTAVKDASVPVGLEPVSIAVRSNTEAWVVNHLSDSVSIVDLASTPPHVKRTLLVGDEPRGIVFAGPGGNRAFIATAHRGQNTDWPNGEYDLEGIGRADVWVFDANDLDLDTPGPDTSLTGDPLTVIQLFGDRPRALTASPDGSTVYAAVYRSGNRTVPISEGLVCNGSQVNCNVQGTTYPAGRPAPRLGYCEFDLGTACVSNNECSGNCVRRETGIIVGFNDATGNWEDENGTNWNPAVRFSLPDLDVFEIDANASTPVETDAFSGVGTILFNMIVNPANGNLYVTNTEANNRVRFEGVGDYASTWPKTPPGEPASVRGNLHRSQITVIDTAGNVTPRHLNKHIPYGVSPVPANIKERSIATPIQMQVSSDGSTLYVAGFGSNSVGFYDTAQLEADTFVPDAANLVHVPRPRGIALDEARGLLWVASQWGDLYTIDTTTKELNAVAVLHNPEPFSIRLGRKFLYDTELTSSNGEASCSSCHVFGDMDDLSWDLGDPDATAFVNPNPSPPTDQFPFIGALPPLEPFDPLKGPMTTQSLRGMVNAGPMHWRGDRTDGATGGDPLDSNAAFLAFNVAFPGLIGRDEGELSPTDMQRFADFALALTYPPNPIRPLDNSLSDPQGEPSALDGASLYNGVITDTVANCNGCHVLDRDQGFFGTSGGSTFENEAMEFKVPHLRNAYQKVGMFGEAPTNFFPNTDGSQMGPQVRGTGFLHDGSVATVFNFVGADVFRIGSTPLSDVDRRDLEAFMMEFDSDLAPIVGQQATLTSTSGSDTLDRIDLLIARADVVYSTSPTFGDVPECDLIVKGVLAGQQRGWLYQGGNFMSDDVGESTWSKSALLAVAGTPGQELTFTCVPPGSGTRMGVNRDRDSFLDANDAQPDRVPPPPPPACSASGAGLASQHGNLAALAFLTMLGLAVVRRRRRQT